MILDYTLAILVISFTGASWSYFLEYLFMPGQLLAKYGKWINQMAGNEPVKLIYSDYTTPDGRHFLKARLWAFPLGACTMCMNVYATVIIALIALTWLNLSLWLIVAILPISSYWLRKVMD
jgi:hypothetical protein